MSTASVLSSPEADDPLAGAILDPGAAYVLGELERIMADLLANGAIAGEVNYAPPLHLRAHLRLAGRLFGPVFHHDDYTFAVTLSGHSFNVVDNVLAEGIDFVALVTQSGTFLLCLAPPGLSRTEAEVYRTLRSGKRALSGDDAAVATRGVLHGSKP